VTKIAETQPLRTGYTTGAAAAAAAVAAFRQSASPVELTAAQILIVPVMFVRPGMAAVVKDGGDDPDVTTGCLIEVTLTPGPAAAAPADFVEDNGELRLIIRGGPGVGAVTRPGLAVAVGKAAINPGPRRMMLQNLMLAGARGEWLATISVPHGEAVAAKTLNPVLGITGGISILGNSGVVYPYSNKAYAASIVLQLKSAAANGLRQAALVTGGRTAAAVARDYPAIDPAAAVRIGDFIQLAVRAAEHARLEHVVIGCMPGKLFKYACGETNTHAHECKLMPERLRELGIAPVGIDLTKMDTMGELAAHLDPAQYQLILAKLYDRALVTLQRWAPKLQITLALYDSDGERRHLI